MQLELFPDFPRIAPPPPPIVVLVEEIDTYHYPPYEIVAENTYHSELLGYIKDALIFLFQMRAKNEQNPENRLLLEKTLIASDLMVYYRLRNGRPVKLAPDVMVVFDCDPNIYRKSFVKHQEAGKFPEVVMEVTSDSNYKKKDDLYKRWLFYAGLGVREYFIVHTKPSLYLQAYMVLGDSLLPTLPFNTQKVSSYLLKVDIYIDENNRVRLRSFEGEDLLDGVSEAFLRRAAQEYAAELEIIHEQAKKQAEQEAKARKAAENLAKKEAKAREVAEKRANSAEKRATQESQARQAAEKARIEAELQAAEAEARRLELEKMMQELLSNSAFELMYRELAESKK